MGDEAGPEEELCTHEGRVRLSAGAAGAALYAVRLLSSTGPGRLASTPEVAACQIVPRL